MLYLETIIALDRGLNHQTSSQEVGTTSTTTKQLKKKMDIDLVIFYKCLYFFIHGVLKKCKKL